MQTAQERIAEIDKEAAIVKADIDNTLKAMKNNPDNLQFPRRLTELRSELSVLQNTKEMLIERSRA